MTLRAVRAKIPEDQDDDPDETFDPKLLRKNSEAHNAKVAEAMTAMKSAEKAERKAKKSVDEAKRALGIEGKLVLSMWGSLGSGHMNATMLRMLPLMEGQQDFCLIHATGSYYYNNFTDTLKTEGIDPEKCGAEIREYIFDAPLVLSAADLVLCRAGASTLAELSSIGKPALIVPSPNVTNNHQEKNARLIEKAGGAKVLLEGEFDEQSLLETIREMLRNRDTLAGMAEAMASLSVTDAVDRIADTVMEYVRKGG